MFLLRVPVCKMSDGKNVCQQTAIVPVRYLYNNSLSGTILSQISTLVNLNDLYVS